MTNEQATSDTSTQFGPDPATLEMMRQQVAILKNKGLQINDDIFKFEVPLEVFEKYSHLIQLILDTESMNDDERQYWYQILPVMTEEQVKSLEEILMNEKKQLAELDAQYEDELNKISEKHALEWKEFETKEKRNELAQKEAAAEKEEANREADILAQLDEL